jgi:hypothetical protein
MSSGVTLNPDCQTVYNELKLGHKFRYIIYSLTKDLTHIEVLKTAPPQSSFDNFIDEFKEAEEQRECRYGVFDAEYNLNDGQSRQKLVFFLWSPESATVKQKMVYTSSKMCLRKALVGIGKEVQACDHGDLAWSNVLEVLLRTETAQT